VTWANTGREYLTLFLKQALEQKSYQSNLIDISDDKTEIAFTDEHDNLNIIHLENQRVDSYGGKQHIKIPFDLVTETHWSSGERIYNYINDLGADQPQIIDQLKKAQKIYTNGEVYAFLLNSVLYTFDQKEIVLVESNVSAATLTGSEIWYTSQNSLKRYSSRNDSVSILTAIPTHQTSSVIIAGEQVYVVIDQILYQVNDQLEKIYSPVSFASFDKIANKLIFGNPHEILIFDHQTHQQELILRSLTPVSQVNLNWETGYVFFANEGKIKAIELDGRDHRNIYTVTDAGTDFALDEVGKNLFVVKPDRLVIYKIR
jgi:hypothetical protein